VFRQVHVEIGFRPEDPSLKAATHTSKGDVIAFAERFNTAAALAAINVFSHKTGFGLALPHEFQTIGFA